MIKKLTVTLIILILTGCASIVDRIGEPEFKLDNITIDSLDGEGIIFRCDYTAVNPYPLAITISSLKTDISYEGEKVVELNAEEGLRLSSGASSRNSVLFKLPYKSVINLAGSSRDKTSLPFTLSGEAEFDVSSIPYLDKRSLSLPFERSFDVPVFRPEIKVTNGYVKLPTVKEVAEALVTGGLNIIRAGIVAGQIVLGKPISEDVFEGVDLDVEILFDLEVDNSGGAPWALDLKRCSIDTGMGALLQMESRSGMARIDSDGGRLQMAATANTLEWGAFIIGLTGADSGGASLRLDGSLSFPALAYDIDLPLEIEQELSLDFFKFGTK